MCAPGYSNCNGNPNDGCEASTSSDPNNCGGCNLQCSIPNAFSTCAMSQCSIAYCNMGYANCNNVTADGCETNTQLDNNNCGFCGNVCGMPTSCVNAFCQ